MSEDAPIVCSLARRDHASRADAFRALFASLTATEDVPGGFRWRFRAAPGLEDALTELAARERACCAFMTISVHTEMDTVCFTATARPEAEATMRAFRMLPDALRNPASLPSALGDVVFSEDAS